MSESNKSIFAVPEQDGFVLMGIVNVTPDSFSDGGQYLDAAKAIDHGLRLHEEGARILDIGGESTRPGAMPVDVEEEIRRVVPVIRGLKKCGAMLSIDTRNSKTMQAALREGVDIVNDISALTHDPDALEAVAAEKCGICLMHSRGTPLTMQDDPRYENVATEILGYLKSRVKACQALGISLERITVDPGIGFGKTLDHNLGILRNIDHFQIDKIPVLLGASRKRFIENLDRKATPQDRVSGSIAVCLSAYKKGIRHFRVHDVAQTRQALNVFRNIESFSDLV